MPYISKHRFEEMLKRLTFTAQIYHESLDLKDKMREVMICYVEPSSKRRESGLTKEQLIRQRFLDMNETGRGGFKAKFLKKIGVLWPPQHGWKQNYIYNGVPIGDDPAFDPKLNPELNKIEE